MPPLECPHLRSPIACLMYQFAFKRYAFEEVLSNEDLAILYDEITKVVRGFHKFGPAVLSLGAECRERFLYLETFDDPSTTPLYRFIFGEYQAQEETNISKEELESIYDGMIEVAKRLDAIRRSRGLTNIPSQCVQEEESDTTTSGNSASASPITVEDHQEETESAAVELSVSDQQSQSQSNCEAEECPGSAQNDNVDDLNVGLRRLSLDDDETVDKEDKENSSSTIHPDEASTNSTSNQPAVDDRSQPKRVSTGSRILQAHDEAEKSNKAKILYESAKRNALQTIPAESTSKQAEPTSKPATVAGESQGGHSSTSAVPSKAAVERAGPSRRIVFRDRVRFTEFIKPYEGIRASLISSPSKKCDGKRLNRPLGVTYDELLEQWIVADTENNRIVVSPVGNILTSPKMMGPCAVCVIVPGHSFAVLTKFDIRIMYHDRKDSDVVVNHSGYARGLALTPKGHLVTLERVKGYWNINVYECKAGALLVNATPYPKISTELPSFMDIHRDLLIITDLGTQSIMRFTVGSDSKMMFQECVCVGEGPTNRGHIEIKYVSGVFIDDDENILVADAKGHSLQVFNSKGIFLHAIKVVNGALPYISGIWVNRNGFIAVCARAEKNGGLYVYRMVNAPEDTKIPPPIR